MDNISDEKLVKRILNGETDLYEILIKKYDKMLYKIGMRFFKNYDDALDFVQEVFLKVYNSLDSFKGIASFKNWLFKISYNHAINLFKKSSKITMENESIDVESNYILPHDQLTQTEIVKVLEEAIKNLPDQYKICVDLYFFMGLSYKEISHITDIPVNTIKSNIYRAKQYLRNYLKGTIAEKYNEM